MRILLSLLVIVSLVVPASAKPRLNKSDEARAFLLSRKDVPESRMSYERPTKWFISRGGSNGYAYVESVVQRWWRGADKNELLVETAIFPSPGIARAVVVNVPYHLTQRGNRHQLRNRTQKSFP